MHNDAFDKLIKSGKVAAAALKYGLSLVKEGSRVLSIAESIENRIRQEGAMPAFPACVCINDVAAHYTPTHDDPLVLRRGQVVKIDLGSHVDGYIADTARTVEVGTNNWTNLIRASEAALETAIEVIRPNIPTRMIGAAVERTIDSFGFRPVVNLTGHSIERFNLHAGKSIPNVGDRSSDVIAEGDIVAMEPFASTGAGKVDGGRPANIYRLLRSKELKHEPSNRMLKFIDETFKGLPFSERWCYRFDERAPAILRKLQRTGLVMAYKQLVDIKGGMVSQAEHTVLVTSEGGKPTTL